MERRGGDPVVIFTMSKTGSTTLVRALNGVIDDPVYKVHLLVPSHVHRAEEQYRRTDPNARPWHILHASHLLRHLPTEESPWRMITVVREPIARAASDFFQSGARRGRLDDPATATARFEEFAVRESIPRTASWFDDEFRASLGVDVLAHAFDPSVGHATIEAPTVRLLVLRQEDLYQAGDALAEFLGLPAAVPIGAVNVGAAKWYSDLYANVLRDARFDDAALELAYGSDYARHFYSEGERARFAERWRTGRGGEADVGGG
jgi:hypothetical protein